MSVGAATQAINFDRKDITLVLGENLDLDNPSDIFITFADDFFKGSNKPSGITKIIFAGARALEFLPAAKDKSLDAFRGVVYTSFNKTQYIVTYWPQDCVDAWGMEDALEGEGDGDDILDKDDGKSTSPTKRSNYSFWFAQDIKKFVIKFLNYRKIKNLIHTDTNIESHLL